MDDESRDLRLRQRHQQRSLQLGESQTMGRGNDWKGENVARSRGRNRRRKMERWEQI